MRLLTGLDFDEQQCLAQQQRIIAEQICQHKSIDMQEDHSTQSGKNALASNEAEQKTKYLMYSDLIAVKSVD